MIVWRTIGPLFLRAAALVSLFVVGVVVLAVSVEKANQGWLDLFQALRFQVLAVMVWLSPLIVALAVSLSCLQQRSGGTQQALACSGVGTMQLTPIAVSLGLMMGMLGFAVGEWVLPTVAVSDLPGWVWTAHGPVRTLDGLLVPLQLEGEFGNVEGITLGAAFPRLASFSALTDQVSPTAATEQWGRLARVVACMGFGWLGLVFARLRQPMIWVAVVCGALTLCEAIAWGLGAQAQIAPWLAGSMPAWAWILPAVWGLRQPST